LRWLFGTETPKKPVSLREALDFPCQQTTSNEPKDDLKKKTIYKCIEGTKFCLKNKKK
jgi:hypothetical protein